MPDFTWVKELAPFLGPAGTVIVLTVWMLVRGMSKMPEHIHDNPDTADSLGRIETLLVSLNAKVDISLKRQEDIWQEVNKPG